MDQLRRSYLDSQVIHNNTVKGRSEGSLQLVAALPFGQDGAQGQAVAKGELGLPAAIQGESGPQLCKHIAVAKPARAHSGDTILYMLMSKCTLLHEAVSLMIVRGLFQHLIA